MINSYNAGFSDDPFLNDFIVNNGALYRILVLLVVVPAIPLGLPLSKFYLCVDYQLLLVSQTTLEVNKITLIASIESLSHR